MAELWINPLLPIKVFNAVILIAAVMMFSLGLPRKDHFWRRLLLWGSACLLTAAAIPLLTDSVWYVTSMFLVTYLMAMLTVRICCKASWPMVFFIAAAAFSAEHIASMLDSIISLFRPDILQYTDTGLLNIPVLLNYTLCRILVFGLVDLLIIRKNRDMDDDSIRFAPSLLFLIISIVVNLYMNIVFSQLISDRSFWLSMFNFAMNIAISLLLLLCQFAIVREGRMRTQLQIANLLRAQAREHYRISKENVEAISMKCHDLKHLLLALRGVIDPKEYDSMMETIDSYGAEIQTNNEVLDVVFQEKNFRCRKLGIQFTCIIDGTAVDFMGTTDQYILFGNLLDNAIEAVSQLPEGEVKNIQVTVRRDKGFVIITTENGYAGELQWDGGRLRTSKKDKQSHGYGILSIEKIVHKYGGRYSINTEDQIFAMNIVLPAIQRETMEK